MPRGIVVLSPWFLGGILVGFGTLVRPETPLLLFAAGHRAIAKLVAAARLGEARARGCADGRRARASAASLGRAQLAHATRSAVSSRRATASCPANSRRSDSTPGRAPGCGASATSTSCMGAGRRSDSVTISALPPSIRRANARASRRCWTSTTTRSPFTRDQDRAFARLRASARRAIPCAPT